MTAATCSSAGALTHPRSSSWTCPPTLPTETLASRQSESRFRLVRDPSLCAGLYRKGKAVHSDLPMTFCSNYPYWLANALYKKSYKRTEIFCRLGRQKYSVKWHLRFFCKCAVFCNLTDFDRISRIECKKYSKRKNSRWGAEIFS